MFKKLVVGAASLVVVAVVVAFGGLTWARGQAQTRLETKRETHRVDFPIPFPLSDAELTVLRDERRAVLPPDQDPLAGVDLGALALERAVARGKHLTESRYGCADCHGKNFGGGTMIDAPPMGRLLGKNLTSGKGGVTAHYTPADWDRIVRHGIKPDGSGTVMPAIDFLDMSDRELSDLIAFIRSLPPVDNDVPEVTFGPVGAMLVATKKIVVAAELIEDHHAAHAVEAPAEAPTADFGKHLGQTCFGCHRATLEGGPIPGGDPKWPPAPNLTSHADGLAGWTWLDFEKAMRTGVRKNGEPVRVPMTNVVTYAKAMSDDELHALWAYLQSVPAVPLPK